MAWLLSTHVFAVGKTLPQHRRTVPVSLDTSRLLQLHPKRQPKALLTSNSKTVEAQHHGQVGVGSS